MLYIAGLVLVIIFILMGFDDFIWDIVSVVQSFFKKERKLDLKAVFDTPPKMMAVMIAAWQEDNVIEDVISHFIDTTIYKKSMYHIFVGVYPNDLSTVEALGRLEVKYPNVHRVINEMEGPTTKAQNLNYVVKQIMAYEKAHAIEFKSFTVHDSEDVVHPFELRLTNYIMEKRQAVQFPVFPLIQYPTFRNFFKNLTTSTYADEFAEHHYITMVHRNASHAFVPSAGTGFALRRDVIELFDEYAFLPTDSLTEDYKLAFELYKHNIHMEYVLDKVPQVTDRTQMHDGYVATRSMFPRTFKTAVRQKKRWITGITMQSIHFKDIFKKNGLTLVGRYSLYRDQKAKIGNLIAFIGYPVVVYFIIDLFFVDLPDIYPKYSLSWYLSLMVTIMMIERLLFRSVAIYKVYGMKSVFFSTFFPPLLPIRYVWGNLINFTATVQAYFERFKNPKKAKQKAKQKKVLLWDKTEHHFLEQHVLKHYYIRLGDVLLKRGSINQKQLKHAFKQMYRQNYKGPMGIYLLEHNYISEMNLIRSLSELSESIYIQDDQIVDSLFIDGLEGYKIEHLKQYHVLPLFSNKGKTYILSNYAMSKEDKQNFNDLYPTKTFSWHYALTNTIDMSLKYGTSLPYQNEVFKEAYAMLAYAYITPDQFMMAISWSLIKNTPFKDVLDQMGIYKERRK